MRWTLPRPPCPPPGCEAARAPRQVPLPVRRLACSGTRRRIGFEQVIRLKNFALLAPPIKCRWIRQPFPRHRGGIAEQISLPTVTAKIATQ